MCGHVWTMTRVNWVACMNGRTRDHVFVSFAMRRVPAEVRLRTFAVQGFRCLANPGEVSLGRPTIIAGPNDGGKTSLLLGLAVLFNDQKVQQTWKRAVGDEQDRSDSGTDIDWRE